MSAAVTWLQRSTGVDVKGDMSRQVHLNVGGVFHSLQRRTLQGLQSHKIFGPILSGNVPLDLDGRILIDRDGEIFRYIVNYLRTGKLLLPCPFTEWALLAEEVRFYELPQLEKLMLDRFEYQRFVFKERLPHGVYVLWPSKVPLSVESAKDTAEAKLVDSVAAATAVPSGGVRIVPPLPGLVISPDCASVKYGDKEILSDVDQLSMILLTVYGYTIQHWDQCTNRILFSLPEVL